MPTQTFNLAAIATKMAGIREFQETERGLIGRRAEMHVTQVAIAAKLHILLYGPPGVAKSMTVDGILKHIPSTRQFKTQAFKASPPEQFLGPLSIKRMAEDEFVRVITNRLADCEVAFIDELSRAPRAVLPAFQGMMVEREFDAGNGMQRVPLMSLIGAVNHLLEDDTELAAFFDRFTLKLIVSPPPSQDQFTQILKGAIDRRFAGEPGIPDELLITSEELGDLQEFVNSVHIPDDVIDRMGELWSNLSGIGIAPSIRRYVDLTKAMQACAALDGRHEVIQDDLQVAQHSLWTSADERPLVYKEVVAFASEWVKDKAKLMDAFADSIDRLGQLQALIASGSDASATVEVKEKSKSIRDHGITLLDEQRKLRNQVERHIADASGQDTAELTATLSQMDAAKSWVSDALLGGLSL
jgi:MoxR-like ATPase